MSARTCAAVDCAADAKARGMCTKHWQRWRTTQTTVNPYGQSGCKVDGCDRPHRSSGYCARHYGRVKRHGDPTVALVAPRTKMGECNHQWKGDSLGYRSAHNRVEQRRGKASAYSCEFCSSAAEQWAYDHADSQVKVGRNGSSLCLYSSDSNRYMPLCGKCHYAWDRDHRIGGESD